MADQPQPLEDARISDSHATAPVNLPRVTITFCTQCKWMLRAAYGCPPQSLPPPPPPPPQLPGYSRRRISNIITRETTNCPPVRSRASINFLHRARRSISRSWHGRRVHSDDPACLERELYYSHERAVG